MNEEKIADQLHEMKIKLLACETSLRIMVFELALILGVLIGISVGN